MDALDFLKVGASKWPEKTLVYLDPPYYVKGRDLYYDYYQPKDHGKVAAFVMGVLMRQRWIVSYDNAPEIRDLYKGRPRVVYEIGYSARQSSPSGREVMFFDGSLRVPPLVGSIKLVKGVDATSKEGSYKPHGEEEMDKEGAVQLSDEETAQRRDTIVRVMANTPPRPRAAEPSANTKSLNP